jgi:cell division protein FtsX
MSELQLALRVGWGTLRSRPTLTLLAISLLSLSTAVIAGIAGTAFLLERMQSEFLRALTVEIELVDEAKETQDRVMMAVESWPGTEFVQYVGPDVTLAEMQKETGDDLLALFGYNPFPPIVRVRFGAATLDVLDSLTHAAQTWPGVRGVFYPRRLWSDLGRIVQRMRSEFGPLLGLLSIVALGLVGLCLRAQVRYRAATWDFLQLIGLSDRTFGMVLLVQELAVGICAGAAAMVLMSLLSWFYSWLFLRTVEFPLWYYFLVMLTAISLALVAGLFSPRRFRGQ